MANAPEQTNKTQLACLHDLPPELLAELRLTSSRASKDERNQEIKRRHAAGAKITELARAYHVSYQRIGQIVRKT